MATWFTYEYCRDVAATAHFYGELIGLQQVWFEDDDVAFVHDGVQLSFTRTPDAPQADGWAFQPGWCHGQLPDAPPVLPVRSTSIALPPDHFRAAVARLQAARVRSLRPEPFWVGYWSFVVADPDGMTVELSDPTTAGPDEAPDPVA